MRACSLILTADIRFACATQVFRWFERPIWKPKSTFSSHFWCTLWWSCLSYKNVVLESTCCVLGPKLCLVSQRIKHNISEYLMQKFEVTNLFFFRLGLWFGLYLDSKQYLIKSPFWTGFFGQVGFVFLWWIFWGIVWWLEGKLWFVCVCVCVWGGGVASKCVSRHNTKNVWWWRGHFYALYWELVMTFCIAGQGVKVKIWKIDLKIWFWMWPFCTYL